MLDFVCHNCGKCCGPVPIVEDERRRIESFLKKHPGIRERIKQKGVSLDCVFRDEEKGCLIYPARPKICKAYTCASREWMTKFEKPKGSQRLINECFGVGGSKEDYTRMVDEYLKSIK